MFEFICMWAVMSSILAAAFYVQIGIEKEKTRDAERKKDEYVRWHNSSRPVKELEAALYKAATLEREKERLEEEVEKLTFEKEELQKELARRPRGTITYDEHYTDFN